MQIVEFALPFAVRGEAMKRLGPEIGHARLKDELSCADQDECTEQQESAPVPDHTTARPDQSQSDQPDNANHPQHTHQVKYPPRDVTCLAAVGQRAENDRGNDKAGGKKAAHPKGQQDPLQCG